ncbi:hypothetical protein [Sphingomonas aerolata]|nr:hypothetical protein [Sphingomonas aerolata]USQ99560.1 hypothetical protein NEF64_14205 [Sphingomonas aerolata]
MPLPATVTIPKADYEVMVAHCQLLACLQAAGVDNWEGYSFAQEMLAEEA